MTDESPGATWSFRASRRRQGAQAPCTVWRNMYRLASSSNSALKLCHENPARRLYERLGFREIPGSAAASRVGGMSIGMELKR